MLKHKEVLHFAYALSEYPNHILDLVCERGATYFAESAVRDGEKEERSLRMEDKQKRAALYHIDELVRTIKAELCRSRMCPYCEILLAISYKSFE